MLLILCGCRANQQNRDAIDVDAAQQQVADDAADAQELDSGEPERPKLVALTFDDGPGRYTEELLDGLEERGARVTFFLMANKINDGNAALVARMAADGHCVASHTYSHPRLHLLTNEEIAEEMRQADEAIAAVTGERPTLVRPPYGNFTTRVQEQIDRPLILWSVDPEDWQEGIDPWYIYDKIVRNTVDGDIILMHELSHSSVVAALDVVSVLQEEGYVFVTVEELFAAKGIDLEAGEYYWSTNKKSVWQRPVFDHDDPYM